MGGNASMGSVSGGPGKPPDLNQMAGVPDTKNMDDPFARMYKDALAYMSPEKAMHEVRKSQLDQFGDALKAAQGQGMDVSGGGGGNQGSAVTSTTVGGVPATPAQQAVMSTIGLVSPTIAGLIGSQIGPPFSPGLNIGFPTGIGPFGGIGNQTNFSDDPATGGGQTGVGPGPGPGHGQGPGDEGVGTDSGGMYKHGGFVQDRDKRPGGAERITAHEREFIMNPQASSVFAPVLHMMNKMISPSSLSDMSKMMMLKFPMRGFDPKQP